jgi:SAM-dependent methyltransferase
VAQISSTYDGIYARRSEVWEDQGRTPQFMRYFSDLAAGCSTSRLLEIGCGEGYLLAQLRAAEKVAVDISAEALAKAGPRAGAACSVALAERLPFAAESFEIVVSVGVMEHFLDDLQATAEICRVLKPSGWYIALVHVKQSSVRKVAQKLREYIYPSFRPLALVRWFGGKVIRPIHQPIQRGYTTTSASACLMAGGLDIIRVISTATEPAVPLVGPHVVIYVTRKRAPHANPR